MPRLTAQTASVDVTDQNFEWYVRSGTFGDINSGQDIVIPAGVRIYTAASSGPVFIADAVTCPAAASSQFFSGTSLYGGSAGNAPSGIFCLSNFTNYTESVYGSLLVTNNYGIVGGSDAESDDDYRYRIRLKLQSPNGANEAALRFQILMIPGIQDVVFAPAAGTFTCYVYGIPSDGSSALLQNVQQAINNTVAFPLTGIAVAPDLVGISLTTTLTLTASATQSDQATIISNAVTAAQNYINNLAIGYNVYSEYTIWKQLRSAFGNSVKSWPVTWNRAHRWRSCGTATRSAITSRRKSAAGRRNWQPCGPPLKTWTG